MADDTYTPQTITAEAEDVKDKSLEIEVTDEDMTQLTEVATRLYRFPHQQAAAFVHDALVALSANPPAAGELVAVPVQPRGKKTTRSLKSAA